MGVGATQEHVKVTLYTPSLGCTVAAKSDLVNIFNGRLNAKRYRNEIMAPFIEQLDEQERSDGYSSGMVLLLTQPRNY